jgi:hypothetical protein
MIFPLSVMSVEEQEVGREDDLPEEKPYLRPPGQLRLSQLQIELWASLCRGWIVDEAGLFLLRS